MTPTITVECEKHEMIGCTLCSGKETFLAANAVPIDLAPDIPAPAPRPAKPPQDPAVKLAGEVASGYRCGICLTPTTGLGCDCHRERVYRDDMAASAEFLIPVIGDTMIAEAVGGVPVIKARSLQGIGVAAQRRAMRRVHLSDAERADEVAGLRHELGLDPLKAKWHQPRNQEASHLPV